MDYVKTKVLYTKLPHYVENAANLTYGSELAACFDICAAIDKPLDIRPGEHVGVPTGIKAAAESPLWFGVNARSGLAIKHGIITIAGIIDSDYRGEWIIGLLNTNSESSGKIYRIAPGDRIAQVEMPFPYRAEFELCSREEFERLSTARGAGGFGSSGR